MVLTVSTLILYSLYTTIIPLISLYVFKEYDTYHYNLLKSYYDEHIPQFSLPQGSILSTTTNVSTSGADNSCWATLVLTRFWKESVPLQLYNKLSTNEKVIQWSADLKEQVTPFYLEHVKPMVDSFQLLLLQFLFFIRPYYLQAIEFLKPKFEIIKSGYIDTYHQVITYFAPHYDLYVHPHLDTLTAKYYEHIHPYYLEHQDICWNVAKNLGNVILGFIIFKIVEQPLMNLLKLLMSDVYDVSQGLENNYKTEVPSEFTKSLVDDIPESEKTELLKKVKKIDSMRPLDTIVNHESDFSGILKDSSSSSSFTDDTPTKVNISKGSARPPQSPKKTTRSASTAAKKAFQRSAKSKQNQKNVSGGSFLAESLVNDYQDDEELPHLEVQVNVQYMNESEEVVIVEQIEDEMADKGLPLREEESEEVENGENEKEDGDGINYDDEEEEEEEDEDEDEDDEDDEDDDEEDDDSGELSQNTEEILRRKINSVSDSSSDTEEKKVAQLPRIIRELSTPQKYNTGLFYSSSRNGLITAAIPLSPSPTKPVIGLPVSLSASPTRSIMSSSSRMSFSEVSQDLEASFTSKRSNGGSIIANPSPVKPTTAILSEETVYLTTSSGSNSELRLTTKKSISLIGEFSSNGSLFKSSR